MKHPLPLNVKVTVYSETNFRLVTGIILDRQLNGVWLYRVQYKEDFNIKNTIYIASEIVEVLWESDLQRSLYE